MKAEPEYRTILNNVQQVQDQITDAGALEIEIRRHALHEETKLVANQAPKRIWNIPHQGIPAADHLLQANAQITVSFVAREAVGEQTVDFGVSGHGFVREGNQAAAQVTDGRHVERFTQLGRASP